MTDVACLVFGIAPSHHDRVESGWLNSSALVCDMQERLVRDTGNAGVIKAVEVRLKRGGQMLSVPDLP